MKAFIWSLQTKLGDNKLSLFRQSDHPSRLSTEAEIKLLGHKMDSMAKCLSLDPYNNRGQFIQWLTPISKDDITPARLLCLQSAECETATCNPRALLQHIRERDVPYVTLLEGAQERQHVAVLTGRCTTCQVSYRHAAMQHPLMLTKCNRHHIPLIENELLNQTILIHGQEPISTLLNMSRSDSLSGVTVCSHMLC